MKRALLALLTLSLAACGSNPPPPPAAGPAPTAAASSSAAAPADTEHVAHPAPRPPPAGPTVTVAFDGHSVDVDVTKVGDNATLAAVWKTAFPTQDTTGLQFDLVGSDGFRPSLRPQCTRPLVAKDLDLAKVKADNHDVSWDDSAKMAHCYNIKALSRLEAKK